MRYKVLVFHFFFLRLNNLDILYIYFVNDTTILP